MAEDLQGGIDDSFHSLSHSSSSFRIVDPGSELPARSRTISAPDTATWEHHHTSSSNSMMYGHSRSESFGRASQYDPHEGNAGHNLPTTVRPVSPQKSRTTPAPKEPLAAVLTATKYIPAPRMLPRVMKKEVWRELFLLSDGRDKAFKLIQYAMKVYLYFHLKTSSVLGRSQMGSELTKRLQSTASGLSLVRKCLIMFNWLGPLLQINNPPPLPYTSTSPSQALSSKQPQDRSLLYRLLHASPPTLLDLFNSLADDTYTLHRLGLVGARIGRRAEHLANWLWFLSTLAGLVEVEAETSMVQSLMRDLDDRIYDVELDPVKVGRSQKKGETSGLVPTGAHNSVDLSVGVEEAGEGLEKLRLQSWSLRITRWKLMMDLIFVSYEVFRVQRFREPAMAFSGLLSAILSSSKLYEKHRTRIGKAHLADDHGH